MIDVALGDYEKTTYVNGQAPGLSANNLNKNENKTEELDIAVKTHLADNTTEAHTPKNVGINIQAAGDLIVGSGADAVTRLTKGTAGQVLRVKSDATGLEWGTGGAWEKIADVTLSSNVAKIDLNLVSEYDLFRLYVSAACQNSGAPITMLLRFDNSQSWYKRQHIHGNSSAITVNYQTASSIPITSGFGKDIAEAPFLIVDILNFTGTYKHVIYQLYYEPTNPNGMWIGGGRWENTAKAGEINILTGTVNNILQNSRFILMGVK